MLLGSQALLLVNSYEHWGTSIETTKVTKAINSIASLPGNCQILAYKNVGKQQNQKQIYIYKTSGKRQMTYSDGVKIQIRRSNHNKASRIRTISRYHYNNHFSQLMFAGIANSNYPPA
ncbi:hypothetical protein FD46_GL001085 [Liquorilactobacillus oeni DSM 19972]|uniref:Uncharacterized protein n=1 Tax=Liquorilactobacillus oeni DSM 19972 TaxID=1423777 RepID=A0A0R1MAE8_9LACO|nr:hypothetical protein FD46_GL001085 [Liquorilactobacillus oeni DSM 19972]